jgi:hypothetical protein
VVLEQDRNRQTEPTTPFAKRRVSYSSASSTAAAGGQNNELRIESGDRDEGGTSKMVRYKFIFIT